MQAVPRPPARRLLCGRYLVPRVALLALPDGPVVGVDLGSGAPIALELLPAGADPGERPTHLGRGVVVSALAPAPPRAWPAPRPRRAPLAVAVRRTLGARRGRVALAATALAAGALACASLLAGAPPRHTRVAPLAAVAAPVRTARVARVRPRPVVVRVAAPARVSRGGAARLLVFAPPRAGAVPVARSVPPRPRVMPRPSGWVDGLVVGP